MKPRGTGDFNGADLSSYQTLTNAQQFFTDFKFAYFRAYGADHSSGGDTSFVDYANLAKQYNVPSGGYFFSTPTPNADIQTDAEAQAQLFIDKLQTAYGAGKYGDLIPMLDVEAYTGTIPAYDYQTLKENALALTSLFETSSSFPTNFGVVAGNFDGQGVSFGAIQFNFGSGTLQPILKDLINQHENVVMTAFENPADYAFFKDLVLNKTKADQIQFGENISEPTNKHLVIEPWKTYFNTLGVTQECIDRQILAAEWYYGQAEGWFDEFALFTRRGYALLFDIAVQSGGISQAVKDLIFSDFANINTTGKTQEEIETEEMVIIANRRADAVSSEFQESYRERKLAIANGSGNVYGGTLPVDTADYDMILEPAFQTQTEWGYPYAWGMTGTQLKDWILFFRNYFKTNTGRTIGLYTNRFFLTETEQMNMSSGDLNELSIMPLWLAEWNTTEGFEPSQLGGWVDYNVWQYDMTSDASSHGVSHQTNDLDHNFTQSLSLIMPPKPPTNAKIVQVDNSTIRLTFTPPNDEDYTGSDIYLNGVFNSFIPNTISSADISVTTPIGSQLQINVVSKDQWEDETWGANTYHTMVDITPTPDTPDEIIDFVGKTTGDLDTSRIIWLNGLASIEIDPGTFGAEVSNYPAVAVDDGTLLTHSTSSVGKRIQFMYEFELDPLLPTPLEILQFKVKGTINEPFTLKFWDHVAGSWDNASAVSFLGVASGYITIETLDIAKHVNGSGKIYISMFSANSVLTPTPDTTPRKFNGEWAGTYRASTGEYFATDSTIYGGGSTALTAFIGFPTNLISDEVDSSNVSASVFINVNVTTAGIYKLGFHNEATNKMTDGVPAYDTTTTQWTLTTGWNQLDITNASIGAVTGIQDILNAGYLGIVLYGDVGDAFTVAYGVTGDSNNINIEVQGDWTPDPVAITLSTDYVELDVFRETAVPPEPDPVNPPPKVLTYDPTEEDIKNMLHAKTGSRLVRFRFDLLDVNENKIMELKNVEHAEISMDSFNTIKRTARFVIRDSPDEPINYLTDRIQPFAEFKLPNKFVQNADGTRMLLEGKWIEYPLGVYLLSSPKKQERENEVYRDIEAYDGLVILEEDKFTSRYTVSSGTKYVDAVIAILQGSGITKYNIGSSDKTLPNDVEYEPGTEKSKPISDFLTAINFTQLYVDEFGYFTSQVYISPSDREANYEYDEDQFSVVSDGMEEELDLYSVPNKWVAVYTSIDSTSTSETSLTSTHTNDNPDSKTSTVSRGRTIVDYRKIDEIADQAALDDYVQRIAFSSSQIYGKVKFQTAIMPFHGFQDVLFLRNETLEINGKYAETSWRFPLVAGSMMDHECRKVVQI